MVHHTLALPGESVQFTVKFTVRASRVLVPVELVSCAIIPT